MEKTHHKLYRNFLLSCIIRWVYYAITEGMEHVAFVDKYQRARFYMFSLRPLQAYSAGSAELSVSPLSVGGGEMRRADFSSLHMGRLQLPTVVQLAHVDLSKSLL